MLSVLIVISQRIEIENCLMCVIQVFCWVCWIVQKNIICLFFNGKVFLCIVWCANCLANCYLLRMKELQIVWRLIQNELPFDEMKKILAYTCFIENGKIENMWRISTAMAARVFRVIRNPLRTMYFRWMFGP